MKLLQRIDNVRSSCNLLREKRRELVNRARNYMNKVKKCKVELDEGVGKEKRGNVRRRVEQITLLGAACPRTTWRYCFKTFLFVV